MNNKKVYYCIKTKEVNYNLNNFEYKIPHTTTTK
jgi:hypothetical protein